MWTRAAWLSRIQIAFSMKWTCLDCFQSWKRLRVKTKWGRGSEGYVKLKHLVGWLKEASGPHHAQTAKFGCPSQNNWCLLHRNNFFQPHHNTTTPPTPNHRDSPQACSRVHTVNFRTVPPQPPRCVKSYVENAPLAHACPASGPRGRNNRMLTISLTP